MILSDSVVVNRGLLLALLETAKANTDLEAIYDDKRGTSYLWSEIPTLISITETELEIYMN